MYNNEEGPRLICKIYDMHDIVMVRNHIFRTGSRAGCSRKKLIGLATAVSEACRIFLKKLNRLTVQINYPMISGSNEITIRISETPGSVSKPASFIGESYTYTSLNDRLSDLKDYFDSFDLSTDDSQKIVLTLIKRLS